MGCTTNPLRTQSPWGEALAPRRRVLSDAVLLGPLHVTVALLPRQRGVAGVD